MAQNFEINHMKIFFKLVVHIIQMQEVDYSLEHELLFRQFEPTQAAQKKCIDQLVKLRKKPESLLGLLEYLASPGIPTPVINIASMLRYLRVLHKLVLLSKQKPIHELYGAFVLKVAGKYLPYHITTQKEITLLNKFADLLKALQIRLPAKDASLLEILLYIASNHKPDGQLIDSLIARLQAEFFADRKTRDYKSLRPSSLLGAFISEHFKVFLPLMERLLMRSESNLQTWKEAFEVMKNVPLDEYSIQCLKQTQDLLVVHSNFTVDMVRHLTSSLKSAEALQACINFIDNLITSNHDDRKKMIALQFLEGPITSASKLNDEDKSLNRILLILLKTVSRVNQEAMFSTIYQMLCKVIKAKKSGPNDEILDACKGDVKGTKYAILCVAQVLSGLYQDPEAEKPAVLKNIVKQFESLHAKSLAKIVTNIQNYLASASVLVFVEGVNLDELHSPIFVNQLNFLSNTGYLRDLYTSIGLRYLNNLPRQGEAPSPLPLSIFLGLSLSKNLKTSILEKVSTTALLRLLSEGVYPYYLYNLQKSIPVSYESARRFVHSVLKYCELDNDLENVDWERVLSVAYLFKEGKALSFRIKVTMEETVKDAIVERVPEVLQIVVQKNFEDLTKTARKQYLGFLQAAFKQGLVPLEDLCQLFLKEKNYVDVHCLEEFNESTQQSMKREKEAHQPEVDLLKECGFIQEPEPEKQAKKEKKGGKKHATPAAKTVQYKMMDDKQVKLDTLRRHLETMHTHYDHLCEVLYLLTLDRECEANFCSLYFKQWLQCMKYAELRFNLYRFVKKVFHNYEGFRKYQDFLAELFVMVGSQQVPHDRTLEKFYVFESDFLDMKFENLPLHLLTMLELVNGYLLATLEFDVNLKIYSVRFFLRAAEDERCVGMLQQVYPKLVTNINLLCNYPETKALLLKLLQAVESEEYSLILDDILNYLPNSKKIVLEGLLEAGRKEFTLTFEEYVKLRILASDTDAHLAACSSKLLSIYPLKMDRDQIERFDLKRFVHRHSNETTNRLSNFAKETFKENKLIIEPMFEKVIGTARELFDEHFDQEGLQFFPNFLQINMEYIQDAFMESIFELLITKFTANEELATLTKLSLDAGIAIIKKYGPNGWELLLKILELYLKDNKGVANVVFLGVLAPYVKDNKNLAAIEKRITSLFESDNEHQQKAISKCMNELMSFFKQPQELAKRLFEKIPTLDGYLQVGQAYLLAGLLKGIGTSQMLGYLNRVLEGYETSKNQTPQEKKGRLRILLGMLHNFGRVLEPKIINIMKLIIFYMSDANESVRDASRRVAQEIMNKLSAFAVKSLLPELLGGLEREDNWRSKVTFIWALGNMAHCAPRQLQACLPQIVPTLSACLSDTHAKIRENSTQALKVIGETIKNPQIFDSIDVLISALSDPYHNSKRALQVLLKTRFSHYIDPPAFSVIVPIINYALRGRDSELKTYACQVIGSISVLIENPEDILPYIEFMNEGLRITSSDPLSEIRAVAAKALGKMSSKIGIANTEKYFKFLNETLERETANSVERQGAAQGLSECICIHGIDYFEESIAKVYELLAQAKGNQKQGYISIFIYVPEIMRQDFEPFIKDVTENMTVFVSDEDQSIRNSSLQVQKILINNFGISHTQMLLEPLFNGLFEENWRKRNGSLILIGEMLNVLKSYLYDNSDEEKEACYYQALMGVYILKDDDVDMPRDTAFSVWNTYIDNTPKTLKMGLGTLVKMWVRGIKQPASGIALRSITNFSGKYGETYFGEILACFEEYLNGTDDVLKSGVYDVLCEFLKRLHQQYLDRHREDLGGVIELGLFSEVPEIRKSVVKTLSIYVEKMHEVAFLEDRLFPRMSKAEDLSEQSAEFSSMLHLFGDLCNSSSKTILETIIRRLVEPPLSELKIEVLTNNASRLANFLYIMFKDRPATEILKEEIINEVKSENPDDTKLKALVYCFNEISVNLSEAHKNLFVQSLAVDISHHSKADRGELSKTERRLLQTLLEILLFFLNGTPAEETGNLQKLISEITPLAFDRNPKMISLVNQIFSSMFSTPNRAYAANYFKQFAVAVENSFMDFKLQGNLPIWEDSESARLYASIFVNTLVYGGADLLNDILTVLNLYFVRTPLEYLKESVLRITGAVIRVSNYRLSLKQRIQLQQFIQMLYEGGKFNLDCYQYQVMTTILKFLTIAAPDKEALGQASTNLVLLLSFSKRRNDLLLDLIGKIKQSGTPLVECLYRVVKQVIGTELLLTPVYEKILGELTALLNSDSSENPLPIVSCYYLSKTAARIAASIGRKWAVYEQLVQGVTCPYNNMLQYLHFSYYNEKNAPTQHQRIATFIKESSKQKVYYLLKSLRLLTKKYPELKQIYSQDKVSEMVSQSIRGFEDIDDVIKLL